MTFMEWLNAEILQPLLENDRALMLKINRTWTISMLDGFALFMRNAKMHIPLYLFFIYWSYLLLISTISDPKNYKINEDDLFKEKVAEEARKLLQKAAESQNR